MRTLRQLVSFGTIGIASNAVLYVLYLGITGLGVGPKVAMTCVFGIGVSSTYALNRRLTFEHEGAVTSSALRYASVYLLAYATNFAAMFILVDVTGLPHRFVMLALIVATATLIFVAQKYWVFAVRPATPDWSR